MAFVNGYTYRKKATIDNTKVSGSADLSSFPVLIKHTDTDLRTVANGGHVQDGEDIRFETTGGVQLDHEIEAYDATTGAIVAWVRIPTLTYNADTELFIYYGKVGATGEENVSGVWANFFGVWHLDEALGSGTFIDRGPNGLDMSSSGSQLTAQIAGKINKAVQRTGDTSEVSRLLTDSGLFLSTGALTYSYWLRPDTNSFNGNAQAIWEEGAGRYRTYTTGSLTFLSRVYQASSTLDVLTHGVLTQGAWTHIAVRVPNAGGEYAKSYTNGSLVTTGSNVQTYIGTIAAMALLQSSSANQGLEASISHVKIIQGNLSADWIATEYANQNSPSTFYTLSAEESSGTPVIGSLYPLPAFSI